MQEEAETSLRRYRTTRKGVLALFFSFVISFIQTIFSFILSIWSIYRVGSVLSESESLLDLLLKLADYLKSNFLEWCTTQILFLMVYLFTVLMMGYGFIQIFKGRDFIGRKHSIRVKVAMGLTGFWLLAKFTALSLFFISIFTAMISIIGLPLSFFISMSGAISLVSVKYLSVSALVDIHGRIFLIAGVVLDCLSSLCTGILSVIIWVAFFDISTLAISIILFLVYLVLSTLSDLFFAIGYLCAALRLKRLHSEKQG